MFFSRRNKIFFTRRITHTVNLKRERQVAFLSRIGIASLCTAALVFVIVYSFQGGATTAQLYPGACSGTWAQPANAQGKPDLDFNASPDAFTVDNSAFVVRNTTDQKQIFCSNFSGDPLLASSSPQLVTLRLSWAIGAKDHTFSSSTSGGVVQQLINFLPSQQVRDQIASSSAASSSAVNTSSNTTSSNASSTASSTAGTSGGQGNTAAASATSSPSDANVGQQTSSSASSPASAATSADNLLQPTASTSLPIPVSSSVSSSSASVAPSAESAPTPALQPAAASTSQPAPAPTSSSTSLMWKFFSPFFLRAFADEVSTTPLVDATASTPALISTPVVSSSSLATSVDQSPSPATPSSTATSSPAPVPTNQSTSTSSTTDSSFTQSQLPVVSSASMAAATSAAYSSNAGTHTSAPEAVSSTSGAAGTSSSSVMPASVSLSAPSLSSSSASGVSSTQPGSLDPTSIPNSNATSTPAVMMFEIRYSLDGSTWQVLADVTKDQMGQAFVVPVSSNDDIAKLQIAVVTLDLSPLSLDQAVYLDGMTLQVTYPAEQKNDVNRLTSDRLQLVSSGGAFAADELSNDDFSRRGTGTVSCLADPFSQTVAVNGTAQYAIHLSGPSDAQFDFAGEYGTLLTASVSSTPFVSSTATSSPSNTATGTSATSTPDVGSAAASSTSVNTSAASGTAIILTGTSTASGTAITVADTSTASGSPVANDSASLLARLMPFFITLGDYPQGIVPALSQDASGTPLVSFSADKTALPGSYTLIVRVMAKYHGQLEKGLCQLNLIVK